MDPADVLTRPARLPELTVRYTSHGDGVLDLHLPPGPAGDSAAPPGLVVLLHGGFWRAAYDRRHTRPLAQALAARGFVVATPEYRRVGGGREVTGGWPTTFDDVLAATSALPELLAGLCLPVGPAVLLGHSAGGHLALWLAAQPLPPELRLRRVVALAPVGDLTAAARSGVGGSAVPALLGGTPDEVPERYAAADPALLLTGTQPTELLVLHGAEDQEVPVSLSRGLAARCTAVHLVELPGVEHYGLIDPRSAAWLAVLGALD